MAKSGKETVGGRNYWTSDRIMWLIIGVAIVVALFWCMWRLQNVLLPFFAACLIAYLLNPLVERFQKWLHLKRRFIPVLITIVLVSGVIVGLGYICMPMILDELNSLGTIVKKYAGHLDRIPIIPDSWQYYIRNFNINRLTEYLNPGHIESLLSSGTRILSISVESLMRIVEWLLMFIYIIFILLDYDQIARGIRKIFPVKYRTRWLGVIGDVERAMNGYFRGQGFVALCACVLYCIGFSIVGLPLSIVMGILVGILYMIPYFQYITLIPVAILCFIGSLNGDFTFWSELGKCALVYVVSQSVCDYVITPHVMGKEMGLNPAIILLALSVWGSLLGITGMIIALPATTLIMSYYERYISNRGGGEAGEESSVDEGQ